MGTIWSKKKKEGKGGASGSKSGGAGAGSSGAGASGSASSGSHPLSSSAANGTETRGKSPSPRGSMERRSLDRSASSSSNAAARAGGTSSPSSSTATKSTTGASSSTTTTVNLPQARLAEDDVRRVLVDLWDVSRSTFSLIGEISTAEYGTPEFWESVETKIKACEEPYQTLRDEKKIQSWVSPLPPGQTGSVMVAAVGLVRAFDAVGQKMQHLKPQQPVTQQHKGQFRETAKLLFQALYTFYVACEMITPEEMNRYVLETAKVGEEVLNFALGNMEFPLVDRYEIGIDGEDVFIQAPTREQFFESQVRQFATQAVKLARASNTRAIQQPSFEAMRTYNDSSFNVVRAARVVAHMGHRAVVDSVDADAKSALINVANGLATQFNKLSALALNYAEREPSWALTPEMQEQFVKLYAAAVKDLSENMEEFTQEAGYDQEMHTNAERILKIVDIVQKLMGAPDGVKLTKATTALLVCVESIAARAFLLFGKQSSAARRAVLDQNPIVREQLVLGLLSALQHAMQFILAAGSKVSYYPIIPPEIVMLNSLRGLLASLSVAFNACVFVLHYSNIAPQSVDEEESVAQLEELTPPIIAKAIVDILHYVRPVKKVQQDIIKEDAQKQEKEREDVLNMMEMTVGLSPQKPANPEKKPSGPEPPRPEDLKPQPKPQPAQPVAKPDPKPEPAKPVAKPEPAKPEPTKTGTAAGAGAGQALKESGKDKGKDKGKGKDDKKPDPKGKGKDDGKKPDPKADPKKTGAATPAATATGAASSTSTTTPTPAPAPTSAAPAAGAPQPNPDGSIPCPVAGLPPLPAGWKIDDVSETNLPPGFPEAPPKAVPLAKGASEDEYKAYMKIKYERDGWDNKLILYKIRMTNVLKSMGKM